MLENFARAWVLLILIGSSWHFGGVTTLGQLWLGCAITVVTLVIIGPILLGRAHGGSVSRPPILLGLCFLLVLQALIQLIPLPSATLSLEHAVLNDWLPPTTWREQPAPISIDAHATLLVVSKGIYALCLMVLASCLFTEKAHRYLLFSTVALNGVALSIFGIVQKNTWNEMLYWTVPLTQGGKPFAAFVNRNNAAGYINLCIAAGMGLLVLVLQRQHTVKSSRPERESSEGGMMGLSWLVLIALVVMTVGVLESTSRGGILSLAAAGLSVFLTLRYLPGSFLHIALVFGVLFLVSLGMGLGESAAERLDSLRDLDRFTDGRFAHWADTLSGWEDFGWLGTGWGTYGDAHRPYQNHVSSGWYQHADSQYVETFVEAGIVGLLLVLAIILFAGSTARRLLKDFSTTDVGLMLTFVIVTQSLQSATDFGIIIPANLFLVSVLLGTAFGGLGNLSVDYGANLEKLDPILGQFLLPFVLIVGSLAGMIPLYQEWETEPIRKLSRETGQQENFDTAELAVLIQKLNQHQGLPDPDLTLAAARFRIQRFRLALVDQMRQADPLASDADLWRKTHPVEILLLMQRLREENSEAALQDLLQNQTTHQDLQNALNDLRDVCQFSPLHPETRFLLACLDVRRGNDLKQSIDQLKREASLSPGDLGNLQQTAILAAQLDQSDLAIACWRRCLSLAPQEHGVLSRAVELIGSELVWSNVVPKDNPELLIAFAKISENTTADAALKTAKELVDGDRAEDHHLRATIAVLQGNQTEAIEHYRRAIKESPLQITWRLEFARLLEKEKHLDEVQTLLEETVKFFPRNETARSQLERVNQAPKD